jgi:hypothetical protein
MEMLQGNQCTAILNNKNVIFFLIKTGNSGAEQVLYTGLVPLGRGRKWGEGVGL